MKYIYLFIASIALISCKPKTKELVRNEIGGGALGTSYSIIYLSNGAQDYQREVDSVFHVLNKSLSTYIPDSDISKINRGDTIAVDHMFQDVLALSQEVYQETEGYFDPTVGALVNAWGFGPGVAIKMDSTRVDSILQFVGLNKVKLTQQKIVQKEDVRLYLDFNAIAKGYAIDRLAVLLDKKGTTDYLIEVGGEIVTKGMNKIRNKTWLVGVDDPETEDRSKPKLKLGLSDKAMASSGNYRKFRIDRISGKKYVHTIDPKTGFTKNSKILATTVLANTCAEADAYATAFMAMDLTKSKALLKKRSDLDAYIIYIDENNVTNEYTTEGFKKLIVP